MTTMSLHVITERADGPDLDDLVRLIRYLRKHDVTHQTFNAIGPDYALGVRIINPEGYAVSPIEGVPEDEAYFVGPDGTVYDANREAL